MANPDGTITVRVKATKQVIDLIPDAARALIGSGIAEEFTRKESTMLEPRAEHAVAAAQHAPQKRRR